MSLAIFSGNGKRKNDSMDRADAAMQKLARVHSEIRQMRRSDGDGR